jgi:hypothetical protein
MSGLHTFNQSLKPERLYSPSSAHTLPRYQPVTNIVANADEADEDDNPRVIRSPLRRQGSSPLRV